VDALEVVDVGRLLLPEARPRSARHEVVEVPLQVRVLEPVGQAPGERAADARLARHVRRDAERDAVGDVAGDVDVGARDLELIQRHAVSIDIGDFRLILDGVGGEDGGPDPDGRCVVGWRIPGGRCDLRTAGQGTHKERGDDAAEQASNGKRMTADHALSFPENLYGLNFARITGVFRARKYAHPDRGSPAPKHRQRALLMCYMAVTAL